MAEFDPTLSELQAINAAFDAENDTAGSRYNDPELHIGLHILFAATKLLRVKEQSDHPGPEPDDSIIDDEVIPDLLKYSLQLAEKRRINLPNGFVDRLYSLEVRNDTEGSAERAINSVIVEP